MDVRVFNACSSRLSPSRGAFHLGKSRGNARHWQPVRSTYSTAHHTSYKSTVRGSVRLRACSNNGQIMSNWARLVSLG